jgi:Uncharacterized protein conserved in bacteria (DUF2252)
MDIVTATREFEKWVRRQIDVVPGQLSDKHKLMAKDPVQFLRGTFYRWAQVFPEVCADLAKSTRVLAVGDLHIASFGTWRDGFGRLIWGIDDFDEAYSLPYTCDLVRLAVSAVIDASEGEIGVGVRNVCDVVLEGYIDGLSAGGRAFVLEEQHKWLRGIALDCLDVPSEFWKKMDALLPVRKNPPKGARKALEALLPAAGLEYRVVRRTAGVGSLGHPRYVAVAEWHGGQIALEAKAATPSACVWAGHRRNNQIYYQTILDNAVRCPDPFVRLCDRWLVRQLAPDSSPIEIESMRGQRNQDRLLHAMAWEAANVHLGTARTRERILSDVKKRPGKWLQSAVKNMAGAVIDDWKEWKKAWR